MNNKGGYYFIDLSLDDNEKIYNQCLEIEQTNYGKPVLVRLEDGTYNFMLFYKELYHFKLIGINNEITLEEDDGDYNIYTTNGITYKRLKYNEEDDLLINIHMTAFTPFTFNNADFKTNHYVSRIFINGSLKANASVTNGSVFGKMDNEIPVGLYLTKIQSTDIICYGTLILCDSVTGVVTNVPVKVINDSDKLKIYVLDDITTTNKTYFSLNIVL